MWAGHGLAPRGMDGARSVAAHRATAQLINDELNSLPAPAAAVAATAAAAAEILSSRRP